MTTTQAFRDVFVHGNGLRHHLVERGRPGAPPIVMIPGQTIQAHGFDPVAARLAESHHVYCLDVRGRGDSDWGPADGYTIDNYVADLEAVRDALGLERMAIVGSHLGGLVAMYYASRHPDRVDRLVLNDIAPELVRDTARRFLDRVAVVPSSFPDLDSVARFYREAYPVTVGKLPDDALLVYAGWQVRWSHDDGAFVWKMDPAARGRTPLPSGDQTPWEMFRSIEAPVLLVRGDQSELVSADTARRMVSEGRDCSVVDVPGVTQTASLTEPESVAAMDRFLGVR